MKILGSMMISCQKAGKLIEKKVGGEISFSEQIQLFFHLRMCEACRQYEKQSRMIQDTLDRIHQIPIRKASEDLKNRIKQHLQ